MGRPLERLAFLCDRLAGGTAWMQRTAWKELTAGNALAGHGRAAVEDPASLDTLEACFAALAGVRGPALAAALADPRADADEVGAVLRAARRLVAAAGLATLLRHRGYFPDWGAAAGRWAYRAAARDPGEPPGLPLDSNWVSEDAGALARRCFRALSPLPGGWEPGPARAAVLHFLGEPPPRRLAGVPILLAHRTQDEGQVARLALALDPDGFGTLFPAPWMLRSFDADWHDALEAAWRRVPLPPGGDVYWEVDGDGPPVTGRSAQAAFEVALSLLAGGGVYDRACAVSATADDTGRLGPVRGLVGDHQRAGPKLRAAWRAGVRRAVLSPPDYRGLSALARDELRAGGLELVEAATVAQARDEVSGLATGIADYLAAVEQLPDRDEGLPAYFGGRSPTAVYVEPDVTSRTRDRPAPGRPAGGDPNSGAGERFGEAWASAEQRSAWAAVVKELGEQPGGRVVVLAEPGQGKTLLTRMTARPLARAARDGLTRQTLAVGEVPLPVVVALDSLLPPGPPPAPGDAIRFFRDNLAAALQAQGHPAVVARYVADHCHEDRAWLVLDALDEVSEAGVKALRVLFAALAAPAAGWAGRVLVTSRTAGYEGRQWPFDREYHLAAFSADQVGTFVDRWFAGAADPGAKDRVLDLLRHNPAIRTIGENPFLLTLICAVAERESLPRTLTRAELYGRAVRLALGGDRRAGEWLPFLDRLAWDMTCRAPRRPEVTRDELLDRLRESPARPAPAGAGDGLSDQEKAVRLGDELSRARLLVPAAGHRTFVFPHRSFAEYLAGCFLARVARAGGWQTARVPGTGDGRDRAVADVVAEIAWQPDWEQVVLFLAGRLAELGPRAPAPLLARLLRADEDDFFRHRLGLAARCLDELTPAARAELPELVSRVTAGVARRWWDHRRQMAAYKPTPVDDAYRAWVEETDPAAEFRYTDAAVGHLARLLPVLARSGGVQVHRDDPVVLPFREWVGRQLRNPRWQDFAVAAFEGMGVEAADPAVAGEYRDLLARLLRDGRRRVRWAAVEALGSIAQAVVTRADPLAAAAALEQLADLLAEADRDNQAVPTTALDVWDQVIDGLTGRDRKVLWRHVRVHGYFAAVAVSPEYLRGAAAVLRRRDQRLRDLRAWLADPSRRNLPASPWDFLYDTDPVVRGAAQHAAPRFSGSPDQDPAAQLPTRLASPDPGVRWVAANWAADLGPRAARPDVLGRLTDLLRDDHRDLRRQAVAALERVAPGHAEPAVLRALEDRVRDEDEDVTVRWAAGRALERLCGPDELGRLREVFDRQPRTRAGWAAGRVARSARRSLAAARADLARRWAAARAHLGDLRRAARGGPAPLWAAARPLLGAAAGGLWSGFRSIPGWAAELPRRGLSAARGWLAEDLVTRVALTPLRELGAVAVTPDYLVRLDRMLRSWWDGTAQWVAAELLAGLQGGPALPPDTARTFHRRLVGLLRARDYAVRWAAVRALDGLHPPAVRLFFAARWAPRNVFTTAGWLKRHLGWWSAEPLAGKNLARRLRSEDNPGSRTGAPVHRVGGD